MNLIKQLQKTPKWKEFEEWYDKQGYSIPMEGYLERDYIVGFDDLEFELTKGVFEKFIESQGYKIITHVEKGTSYYSLYRKGVVLSYGSDSFEKLLIWYFNN